jgi:methylated-DNA-[protein]-cysteine S-methyltransferase
MKSMPFYYCLETPIGRLKISGDEEFIRSIAFDPDDRENFANGLLQECAGQLEAYFAGKLKVFDLPFFPHLTGFGQEVLEKVSGIPFGETRTYAEIALELGNPKSVRAVGQTNGRNPLPILIPCHRVIGTDGSLTGYSGGIWRKKWLLQHEFSQAPLPLFSTSPS